MVGPGGVPVTGPPPALRTARKSSLDSNGVSARPIAHISAVPSPFWTRFVPYARARRPAGLYALAECRSRGSVRATTSMRQIVAKQVGRSCPIHLRVSLRHASVNSVDFGGGGQVEASAHMIGPAGTCTDAPTGPLTELSHCQTYSTVVSFPGRGRGVCGISI